MIPAWIDVSVTADQYLWNAVDVLRDEQGDWRAGTVLGFLKAACQEGSKDACKLRPRYSAHGKEGVREWLDSKCELKGSFSCSALTEISYCSYGEGFDRPACVERMMPHCQAGSAHACAIASRELSIDRDQEAIEMAKKACAAGDGFGCHSYALALSMFDKDEVAAAMAAQRGCLFGSPLACFDEAAFESLAWTDGKESRVGLEALKTACERGYLEGCETYAIGLRASGLGHEAVRIMRFLCLSDEYAPACKRLKQLPP
jgi:hypothetical protein